MTVLAPETILKKRTDAQVIALEDGRLMIRGQRGTSVRPAFPLADLERVLAEVDGERSLAEIKTRLSEIYEPEDVASLLETLLGDLLETKRSEPEPSFPTRIAVWGQGPAYERFLAEVQARGWPMPQQLMPTPRSIDLEGFDLLIGLPSGPLRSAFMVQRLALRAGLTSVILSGDGGQVYLGPPTLAQHSPCLGCLRAEAFSDLIHEPGTRLHELGKLSQDLAPTPAALHRACALVLDMVAELVQGNFTEYLRVQVVDPQGRVKTRHQTRRSDCPLCRNPDHEPDPRYVVGALEGQRRMLQSFTQTGRRAGIQNDRPSPVCVLGGGTAGYLAALALVNQDPNRQVTLIHSSKWPIIGVGEATTPLMPQFLHADLRIDPDPFFRQVQPTLKLGIRFEWGGARPFNYPFGPNRVLDPWFHESQGSAHRAQSLMMDAARVPFHAGSSSWLDQPEMAYHLDNPRLARFLAEESARRGIQLLDREITEVERSEDGRRVSALVDADGVRHAFGFYLDCSGFRSLLLGSAMDVPFVDFSKSLFTDRAWVGAVPVEDRMRPYTTASATEHGWCWDIPQMTERHLGYVFCSAFASDDAALAAFRRRYPELGETRLIRFKAGRRASFVRGNVAALGNAYGFVEPLESTSLHLTVRQLGLLLRHQPFDRQDEALERHLNRQVNGWWDYVSWFLALHFKYNRASSSAFWDSCRAEVDVSAFGELIELFQARGPLSMQPGIVDHFQYPDPLWGPEGVDTLLLGMGLPCNLPKPESTEKAWRRWRLDADRLHAGLSDTRAALEQLQRDASVRAGLARCFQSAGAAFR